MKKNSFIVIFLSVFFISFSSSAEDLLSKVKSFFGKTNYSDEELSAISLDKLEEMCFSKNIVQACNYAGKKVH